MPTKYCTNNKCGERVEYSALNVPEKCPSCGQSFGYAKAALVPAFQPIEYAPKPLVKSTGIELSKTQQDYIAANYTEVGTLDIAQTLFPDVTQMGPMTPQYRSVNRFINELVANPRTAHIVNRMTENGGFEDVASDQYDPREVKASAQHLLDSINPEDISVSVNRSNVFSFGELAKIGTPAKAKKSRKK